MKYEAFVLGGFSSCTAELITFPIDVTKTRIQIERQYSAKYRTPLNCLSLIIKEEGFTALYGGLKPALLRQAVYGTFKLGFYQILKKKFSKNSEEKLHINILAGMISGGASMAICNPTDVLKVRMQSNQSDYKNRGIFRSIRFIYRTEGLKGLYRGTFTNSQYTAITTGAELASYDFSKHLLIKHLGLKDNTGTHLSASCVAGICGTLASAPFDTVKARMMAQHISKNCENSDVFYKNTLDCFKKVIKTEGVKSLYKSVFAAYMRMGPWNMIFFLTYEKLKSEETKVK